MTTRKRAQITRERMARLSEATTQSRDFSRSMIEAGAEAAKLWTSGMQDLSRRWFENSKSLNDDLMTTAKAVASARSMKEVAELQAAYVKWMTEQVPARMAELNEATVKLAKDASAPVVEQVTAKLMPWRMAA